MKKKKESQLHHLNQESYPITQNVCNTNIFKKLFFAVSPAEFCALKSNSLQLFIEML